MCPLTRVHHAVREGQESQMTSIVSMFGGYRTSASYFAVLSQV
jgi:hypothetical protein